MRLRLGLALSAAFLVACTTPARVTRLRERVDALLAAAIDPAGPGGTVIVVQGGRTLFRGAYGLADVARGIPMTPETRLRTGSITKQFTAVAILELVERGELELDDDVRMHVPDFSTGGRVVTIEQVLTHTAGLVNLVELPGFEEFAAQEHTLDELLARTNGLPLAFEPGAAFDYSDSGYLLLAAIVERTSGTTYAEFLRREILEPAGLFHTSLRDDEHTARGYTYDGERAVDPPYLDMSVAHAAGALVSTVDDLARWDRALCEGRIVSRELLERAWTPRTLPDGRPLGYGFGWDLCELAGFRTVEHGGWINGFTAYGLRVPDAELFVAVLVNNDASRPDAAFVARRVAHLVLTGSPDLRTHELTASERAALLGVYEIAPGDRHTILERDGALFSRRNDGVPKELVALGPTELAFADSEGTYVLRFLLDPGGRAREMQTYVVCEPGERAFRVADPR